MLAITPSKNGILRDICEGRVDEFKIDPAVIIVEKGFNLRDFTTEENKDHLANNRASLIANGQLQPLLVETKDGKIYLRGGETRLRNILQLRKEGVEWPTVRVRKVDSADDDKRLTVCLTENTGKPFSIMELGAGFDRYMKWGWTVERIAKTLGYYSESFIKRALELNNAPGEARELVASGAATPAAAIAATRKGTRAIAELKAAVASRPAGKNGKAKPVGRTKAKPKAPEPKADTATKTEVLLALVNIIYSQVAALDNIPADKIALAIYTAGFRK